MSEIREAFHSYRRYWFQGSSPTSPARQGREVGSGRPVALGHLHRVEPAPDSPGDVGREQHHESQHHDADDPSQGGVRATPHAVDDDPDTDRRRDHPRSEELVTVAERATTGHVGDEPGPDVTREGQQLRATTPTPTRTGAMSSP